MKRRKFIESVGATCRNWTWSWAFVNHAKRTVIFGAWDRETSGGTTLILDETWQLSRKGRKQPGYPEALECIRLVESDGYTLQTFPMLYSARRLNDSGLGPSSIAGIIPELTSRTLNRIGTKWYASTATQIDRPAEEVHAPETYIEGASKQISVNAYERNAKAREACIQHYGCRCYVCDFEFGARYGGVAAGLIHVHHIVPIADVGNEYALDPVQDLRPVCPNCHAVIHRTYPPIDVEELKTHLAQREDA